MDIIKGIFRAFLPQNVINIFYHLPLAFLANVLYGFPTRKLKVVGVTGTDGKTTTTNMIYQILKSAGKRVSMVSTINAYIGGKSYDTGFHVTSPDHFMVQKFAKKALDNGDEYLVLEVTSHALDQYRFWGVKFDVGVITNITHEHLDYHKTFKKYQDAKLILIRNVKYAVVNEKLIPNIPRSEDVWHGKKITFGLDKGDFNQKEVKLKLKIPGDYNIENALTAMAVASAFGIDQDTVRRSLENFQNLIGRMEEIKNSRGIKIIIDFAHTPNGLEKSLMALGSQAWPGRLIALIGCEGYRDVGKRAMMGAIAQKLSDIVIVTAVDPRGQMEIINKQVVDGAKKAGAKMGINLFIIEDRYDAINFAINELARHGDVIGIFGKGHEKSMNLDGKKEVPWSDMGAVEKVLN